MIAANKGKSVIYYFDSPIFEMKGRVYMLVGCEITGKGIYDCVDTVKNQDGVLKVFKRLDLINLIKKGNE